MATARAHDDRDRPATIWVLPPVDAATVAWARGWLTVAELARADRLQHQRDHRQFVMVRAALRLILARMLLCRPEDVEVVPGPHGKPVLRRQDGPTPLFSVSRSRGLALIVVHPSRPVGVDAERVRGLATRAEVERWCTRRERRLLRRFHGAELGREFLRLWVRKEAVAKADGRGLLLDLAQLHVARAGPVSVPAPSSCGDLEVYDLDLGPWHFGALATHGVALPPVLRRWQPSHNPGTDPSLAVAGLSRRRRQG